MIFKPLSGQVLDVPFSSQEPGQQIGTYGRHGGANQIWYINREE